MGRKKTRNIRDLRDEYDAAERRRTDEEDLDEDEDIEDEDEDEEEDEDTEDEEDEDLDEDIEDEDDEEAPKKKKAKKAKAKPKAKVAKPRAKRTRTVKVTRMRVVWAVYNNSHQLVKSFPYKEKAEAEEFAAKQTAAKANNIHFVQPLKEAIEEEKT